MVDIYKGNIYFPTFTTPLVSIGNKNISMDKTWYRFFRDIYRNTRLGDTATNGLLSNQNLTETGTEVTLVSGSTLTIEGTLDITSGSLIFNSTAPTDGSLLIGHNANGTYQEGNIASTDGSVDITNNAGAIDIDINYATVEGIAAQLAWHYGG